MRTDKPGLSTGVKLLLGCLSAVILGGVMIGGACILVTMRAGSRVAQQRRNEIASLDGQPSASVTAQQLINDYKTNEIEADSRYKGHIVQVTGEILTIGQGPAGGSFVSLKGGRGEIRFVQCMLVNPGDGPGLRPDQPVTIRGVGRGMREFSPVQGGSIAVGVPGNRRPYRYLVMSLDGFPVQEGREHDSVRHVSMQETQRRCSR